MNAPSALGRSFAIVGILLAGGLLDSAPAAGGPDVAAMLTTYLNGDPAGAVAGAASLGPPDRLSAIERAMAAWVDKQGAAASRRRALAAAAWSVEIARARRDWPEWALADLIVSDRELVWRHTFGPPTPAEHAWWRLALAALASGETIDPWCFANGAADGAPAGLFVGLRARAGDGGLVARAIARFPDDADFRLFALVADDNESRAGPLSRLRFSDDDASAAGRAMRQALIDRPQPDDDRQTIAWRDAVADARLALRRFDKLPLVERGYAAMVDKKDVAADARVRLGEVRMRLGRYDEASALFAAARTETGDPVLRYMTELFDGWISEREHHSDAAAGHYRAALEVIPGAASASLLAAAIDFASGDPARADRAVDLLAASSTRPPDQDDPWLAYKKGDGRFIEQRILEMREALR